MGKLTNRNLLIFNLLIFISLLVFIICFKGMPFSQTLAQGNEHKLTPDTMENLQQIGEITVGDISQLAFDGTGDYLVIGSKSGGIATYNITTQALVSSPVEGVQGLAPLNRDNYIGVAYRYWFDFTEAADLLAVKYPSNFTLSSGTM